jgi:hypothetical protein
MCGARPSWSASRRIGITSCMAHGSTRYVHNMIEAWCTRGDMHAARRYVLGRHRNSAARSRGPIASLSPDPMHRMYGMACHLRCGTAGSNYTTPRCADMAAAVRWTEGQMGISDEGVGSGAAAFRSDRVLLHLGRIGCCCIYVGATGNQSCW